jgi:hypothetical protein
VAVFKGFIGNRKVGEFLLVAQWQSTMITISTLIEEELAYLGEF